MAPLTDPSFLLGDTRSEQTDLGVNPSSLRAVAIKEQEASLVIYVQVPHSP
jgi:hypothetical protein